MKIFTYKDYIYSIHTYRLHAIMGLAEETEEYKITGEKIKDKHDVLMKNIFKDANEVAKFINEFLNPKKQIEAVELEKYTNNYINRKYQKKEADIVYRVKDKAIYYLIEHQSNIDHNMPFRILNYCINIIQEWTKGKKIGKETKYPIVVPIVIYTGEKRSTTVTSFSGKQIKETTYGSNYINLSYNLIDINRYSAYFFLKKDSMFSYCMLIEKANNTKELLSIMEILLKQIKEKERLLKITDIILDLFSTYLEKQEQEELITELDKKVGEKKMSTLMERIEAGDKKRLKQKEKEVTKKVSKEITKKLSKRMLQKGISIELIEEISQLKREEIEN